MERKYDVFISFKNSDANGNKTIDSDVAHKLYKYLTDNGLKVFFSNVELEYIGKAQYTQVIDEALETSRFLIAVGCSYDNLNSQWVRYEWESFINDIRSGIKPDAEVFVLYQDITIKDLPRALRQQQAFDANDENSYLKLSNFIINASERLNASTGITENHTNINVQKQEIPSKESKNEKESQNEDETLKKLHYIDRLQGYFSRDFNIMRDEYISFTEILKDEKKIEYCKKRATECRNEYSRLTEEEEPSKKKMVIKITLGLILQLILTIAYSIVLWSTDYIHIIWNTNNYLYKLLPLTIFPLLIGCISVLLHRDTDAGVWGMLLDLYVGIAQLITACVWVYGENFRLLNFIGYFLLHLLLIVLVLIPGILLSFIRFYDEDEIRSTIVKDPSKKNVEKYNEMLNRHKKVYGKIPVETAIVYNNLGATYAFINEPDIAFEYYQKALEINLKVLGEEKPSTAKNYYNIGLVCDDLGDAEKALEYYSKALKIREKILPPNHEDIINASKKIKEINDKKA